ncbi:MAG: hypothetical protein CL477_15615 [Acidobacteria bacterium]|jgi:hypothetical protein|nr:hypothetical protein [Acidobacteriota bacterium]MDP7478085.1 hypothetical protein [Vicinamibacterales bacterium]|tara:strand:- start:844 stop:1275 length:432 start_codon:yes stop_codon:yes gene_type:complete
MGLRTEDLMQQVRRDLREKLQGSDTIADYVPLPTHVLLRELLEDHDLVKTLTFDPEDWELRPKFRISSHRPFIGPILVFLKRAIGMPLVGWVLDYSTQNFRRQKELNDFLLSCLRALVLENARRRHELAVLRNDISTATGADV